MRNAKLRAVMTRNGMKERLEMLYYCTEGRFGHKNQNDFIPGSYFEIKTPDYLKVVQKLKHIFQNTQNYSKIL